MDMFASSAELQALQAFCKVERELQSVVAAGQREVRDAMDARDECMTALLACMEERGLECASLADVGGVEAKYLRITQSHTTRDLSSNLVKHTLLNKFDHLLQHWTRESTPEEVAGLVYSIVKEERNTFKPLVTFSNSLPRGVKDDDVFRVVQDADMVAMVHRMRASQQQHAHVLEVLRKKRDALEQQRSQHVEAVDAFMTSKQVVSQCIMDATGNCMYLRKKTSKRTQAMTVPQFKQVVSHTLTELQQELQQESQGTGEDDAAGLHALRQHRERIVARLVQAMDACKTVYVKDVIKLDTRQ
jgi:hypothetical protein